MQNGESAETYLGACLSERLAAGHAESSDAAKERQTTLLDDAVGCALQELVCFARTNDGWKLESLTSGIEA